MFTNAPWTPPFFFHENLPYVVIIELISMWKFHKSAYLIQYGSQISWDHINLTRFGPQSHEITWILWDLATILDFVARYSIFMWKSPTCCGNYANFCMKILLIPFKSGPDFMDPTISELKEFACIICKELICSSMINN